MTALTVSTADSTHVSTTTSKPSLWRAGVRSGVVAAVATTAVAAVVHAAGVSLEDGAGKAFPLYGFAQLTLFFTAVGVLIAAGIRRRASRPHTTFVRTTVALTALSLVPDAIVNADTGTKLALACTHLVAAAIVIPAIAARLED
jgi:peptidoglycan/LPS O-acetylase OafA/YrhL